MEHIYSPYNKTFLDLGFVTIQYYALFIVVGALLGLLYCIKECKKFNIDKEKITDAFIYGFVFAIIGARLYYVIFEWHYYIQNPVSIIMISHGGLAIHGGLIATAIYLYYYTRKHKINILAFFEGIMPGFLIGQSLGRWGNFMNQEAHGPIISGTLDEQRYFLSQTLHLPDFITNQMYLYGDSGLGYYHPTFLYESLWNILGLIILIFVLKKLKKYLLGDALSFYLIWYGIGRYFIESLRTDALMLGDVRVAQLASIIMIIFGAFFTIYRRIKNYQKIYYQDYLQSCREVQKESDIDEN